MCQTIPRSCGLSGFSLLWREHKQTRELNAVRKLTPKRRQKSPAVLADTVYNDLRSAILGAELRPNCRLVEDDLAESLGVSRTPVRESLFRLEQEGLVDRSNGWIVREISPAEIRFRPECRLTIEGYADRLAADRACPEAIEEFRTIADEMDVPDISRVEFNRINDRFHKLIAEAADNPVLIQLLGQTKMNCWDLSMPVVFGPAVDCKVHEQHRALIDAIAAGEGDRAEEIARAQVQMTNGYRPSGSWHSSLTAGPG